MSDKISISLHNSDLFLNPEFTDTAQQEINTDNAKNSILKKGPTLGENNHLVSLHNSYLLPPLHSSTYLSKAVTSYLHTKQKVVHRDKSREGEQDHDHNQNLYKHKQNQPLLSAAGANFGKSGKSFFPLRYELRSGLTPYSKAEVELEKKDVVTPTSNLVEQAERAKGLLTACSYPNKVLTEGGSREINYGKQTVREEGGKRDIKPCSSLNQTKSKHHFGQLDNKIDNKITKSFSRFYLKVFDNLNKGICSSFSREFLLVTTNLMVFTVFAIVQRSNYGKTSSLISGKSSHNILCGSQMSNITPSYLSTAGVRQYLHEIQAGYLNPVREHIVGVFLGKSDISICQTEKIKTNKKNELFQEKNLSFSLCTGTHVQNEVMQNKVLHVRDNDTRNFDLKVLSTNSPQKSIDFTAHLIQPWYCIKACNALNNKVVATRSLWQVDQNVPIYNDSQIRGFQYYLPFYKSKERIFAETDTIPSKKDTVYSQKTINTNTFRQLEPSSCRAVSELILKRFFYKYGLLLVLSSKKDSEFQISKEIDKSRVKSSNDSKQHSESTEIGDNIVDDMHAQRSCANSHKSSYVPPIFINKGEFDDGSILHQGMIKVQNGYVLLAKRYFASFLQVYQNVPKSTSVKKGSHIRFNTLKTTGRNNPFLSFHEWTNKDNGYLNQFFLRSVKALLPLVREPEFSWYSFVYHKIDKLTHPHKTDEENKKAFFPSGFAWSKYNLTKLGFTDFDSMQNDVPLCIFMPDSFVRNISVSGYQFPELRGKEISYLFRKRVIFHFYFNCHTSYNNTFIEKLLTQITTPFRTLKSGDLVTQVVSTPFFINNDGVMVCQVRTRYSPKREIYLSYPKKKTQVVSKEGEAQNHSLYPVSLDQTKFGPTVNLKMDIHVKESNQNMLLSCKRLGNSKDIFKNKFKLLQGYDFKNVRDPIPSFEMDDIKMQYTQVDLDEIKNISDVFQKLGRNYEDYLRQPKDSLPVLIISPSLEDDRDIEEEGIRIFRKRDFVKNQKTNSEDTNGEGHTDSAFFVLNTTSELPDNKIISGKAASKNDIQNHQFLVKNALRQAQEEIDNIAKKEEKGSEKDKQVIPPLTRLEALYTIRNRERKREQAKDFMLDKGIISPLRSNKAKWSSHGGIKLGYTNSETNQATKHTSLPIFDKLFLCSDKPINANFNSTKSLRSTFGKPFTKPSTWSLTTWLFSKFGDQNICTDRKHSFFGEMSLPSKKVTAQEQKQIFQQKTDPLLKVQTENKLLFASKAAKVDHQNLDFHSVSSTIPLSLLSQFSVFSKTDQNINKVPQFKIGSVKGDRLLSSTWASEFVKRQNVLPMKVFDTSFNQTNTGYVNSSPDLFVAKNRIYFYNTFSQNKPCQGSAPKIKNTPLQSPVAHRVWQPKRMEPSTFRVSQRIQSTPVLPRITQKDWKQIMEWQLKKYFVEEDKRLLPLVLKNNNKLKIKRLNLYLPWIFIKKGADSLNKNAWYTPFQPFSGWPLTRLDLRTNCVPSFAPFIVSLSLFPEGKQTEGGLRETNYGKQTVKGTSLCKASLCTHAQGLSLEPSNVQEITQFGSVFDFAQQSSNISYKTTGEDKVFVHYWQLPTQQKSYTAAFAKRSYANRRYTKTSLSVQCKPSVCKERACVQTFGLHNEVFAPPSVCKHALHTLPLQKQTNKYPIAKDQNAQQSLNLRTINARGPVISSDNRVLLPKKNQGIFKKVFNDSILFESVTKYSWLFIYTFVFVLIFKQLFTFVYKVGLKDFFINFLNSDFGRTITSEEFRYSIQNAPLAELYRPTKRLEDLFGLQRNKVQLLEIVWFLRNNCQGRNGVRGILLVGPPGVENISVVQAIAGEANLPIIVQSLEKIAQDNEPQRKLEQLYMRAHKQAPCVLFLDQLDTIGARRDQLFTDSTHGGNGNPLISSISGKDKQVMSSLSSQTSLNSHISDINNTISSNSFQKNQNSFGIDDENLSLNKNVTNTESLHTKQSFVPPGNKLNVVLRLLTILDGITQSSGVVTVATARDLTKLDPALLRPKRFDRRVYLSLPNQHDRVHLFKIQTQSIGHIKEIPWNYLSLQTENMSAADIKSAINYSLFRAVLKNSVHTLETLEYGISCVKSLTDKRVEKK